MDNEPSLALKLGYVSSGTSAPRTCVGDDGDRLRQGAPGPCLKLLAMKVLGYLALTANSQ